MFAKWLPAICQRSAMDYNTHYTYSTSHAPYVPLDRQVNLYNTFSFPHTTYPHPNLFKTIVFRLCPFSNAHYSFCFLHSLELQAQCRPPLHPPTSHETTNLNFSLFPNFRCSQTSGLLSFPFHVPPPPPEFLISNFLKPQIPTTHHHCDYQEN